MSRALRAEWDDVDEWIVEVTGPNNDTTPVGLNIALPSLDSYGPEITFARFRRPDAEDRNAVVATSCLQPHAPS
jgi:hypothetical protein